MQQEDYPEPFYTFSVWLHEHVTQKKSAHPAACVLSTVGHDGYPNARYVALKELKFPHLIITGSLLSRKAKEIEAHPQVALSFWWEESNRQVRIQGTATQIDRETASFHFANRDRIAQLVSSISQQGAILDSIKRLKKDIEAHSTRIGDAAIPCPSNWGGYQIAPQRIEFMEFKTSRLHKRTLYTQNDSGWSVTLLQP